MRSTSSVGLFPHRIDEVAVQHAIAAAQLEALVASPPVGLATLVGERAVRLSGVSDSRSESLVPCTAKRLGRSSTKPAVRSIVRLRKGSSARLRRLRERPSSSCRIAFRRSNAAPGCSGWSVARLSTRSCRQTSYVHLSPSSTGAPQVLFAGLVERCGANGADWALA